MRRTSIQLYPEIRLVSSHRWSRCGLSTSVLWRKLELFSFPLRQWPAILWRLSKRILVFAGRFIYPCPIRRIKGIRKGYRERNVPTVFVQTNFLPQFEKGIWRYRRFKIPLRAPKRAWKPWPIHFSIFFYQEYRYKPCWYRWKRFRSWIRSETSEDSTVRVPWRTSALSSLPQCSWQFWLWSSHAYEIVSEFASVNSQLIKKVRYRRRW